MPAKGPRKPRSNSGRAEFTKAFGKPIEEYDSFKRAIETVGEVSQHNYARDLHRYFIYLGEDPDTVIKNRRKQLSADEPEQEEYYERKTTAYINQLKAKKLAGRGITGILGRIQGFFSNNSSRYSLSMGNLRIPKARRYSKFSPENNQVREMISHAEGARDRLIVTLMYQCGAAPVDVSELQRVDLPQDPWVYFEKSRSKTGEVWRGVSTPDLCIELNAYLKLIGAGEASELLFRSREGYLDNAGVSRVVADLIEKAGYGNVAGFVPKCLRDGLEDALVDANVHPKLKAALMAHTSDIQHQYGSDKKMQENLIKAMQAVYPFICLNDVLRSPAELAGFSVEDVAELKEFLKNKTEWKALLKLSAQGDLVNIKDPELPKRLRDKGVIP
jgi:integrase